ncbi:MAG: M23 family metallopeptidase [Amphiplicatus sp.]
MRSVASILCAAAAGALAACATTPREPARSASASVLMLCPMKIANPPAARNGRVKNFKPYADVRGKRLARAPVEGCLSSGYGPRSTDADGYHYGIDLYTKTPAPVHAAADGLVEAVKTIKGYGKTVIIGHGDGVKTLYAHLSSVAPGAKRGARVRGGEVIAQTGSSGNASAVHLHYEVLIDAKPVNPLNVGR